MTIKLTATEAKAKLLALLDAAADGEEFEITKRGHTVARLVPAAGGHDLEGAFTGVATTAVDDELLFSTGALWSASGT